MSFQDQQKSVATGMAIGALLAAAIISYGIFYNPFQFSADMTPVAKFGVALKSTLLLAFCLAFSIGRQAKHRFFTKEDIDGAGLTTASARAKYLQAILQNTLEQVMFAVIVYVAWASLMPGHWLSVIPLAALAFLIGRFLFFGTYKDGPSARAIGFTLSFYVSVGMLLVIAGCELLRWI